MTVGEQGDDSENGSAAGDSDIAKTLANVQVATGETKREHRSRLMRAFNTPFFPDIFVCSEVMGEGVDLFPNEIEELARLAAESSLATHASPQCLSACRYMAIILAGLIHGLDREEVLSPTWEPLQRLRELEPIHAEVDAVALGIFRELSPPSIKGSGYVVKSLEAALWAFHDAEIAEAPIRTAVCHIPLRGRPGENDGTTLEGYASYSGVGAKLWLPILRQARFRAVISGHTHRHRIDEASDTEPVMQVVGGGPQLEQATLTILRAEGKKTELRIEDRTGKLIHRREWVHSAG